MTLDEYCAVRGRQQALADATGLHASYLSGLRRGRYEPSLETIRRIDTATNGEVGPMDWFPAKQKGKKK